MALYILAASASNLVPMWLWVLFVRRHRKPVAGRHIQPPQIPLKHLLNADRFSDLAAYCSVSYMEYVANVVTECVVLMRWTYAMPVCVLFVSSKSGTIFSPGTSATTPYNQSAKDIYPYLKTYTRILRVHVLCGGPRPMKASTHVTEWVE